MAAVVENRAREVGLAVLPPGLAVLEVQQLVEASPSCGTTGGPPAGASPQGRGDPREPAGPGERGPRGERRG